MTAEPGAATHAEGAGRPFLGSAQGGLRYELVRSSVDGDEPFVCLHSGRFSQVLLARVAAGYETLRPFALKLQRDSYLAAAGMGRAITNADVEAMWQREQRELRQVASPHVVRTLPLAEGPMVSRPVVYCPRTDEYFHPLGPGGHPLSVCTDDDVLRDSGLRAWSNSLVRYLHSPGQPNERRFYRIGAAGGERVKSGVTLRLGSELFRDWRELVHGELADADRSRVEADFPCRTCEHRGTCYPADAASAARLPVEDVLVALSYYDFHMVPLEVLDLTYDELCDLLGGAPWSQVRAAAVGPGCRGREQVLGALDRSLGAPLQWMFEHDDEKFVLEILRAKLAAFREVCDGVRAVHAACKRPHLAVLPSNFMAVGLPRGSGVPARWCFQTRLIDLGSPLPFAPPDASARDAPPLLEPGSECRGTPFLSPFVESQDDALSGLMQVVVQRREQDDGVVRLRMDATGRGVKLSGFRPGDAVRILPSGGGHGEEVWVWSQIVEVRRDGVTLTAELPDGHAAARWTAPRTLDANLTFYRNYGTACDLFGLGMLLFRTLLVHDQQDTFRVDEVVRQCLRRIGIEAQGRLTETQCHALLGRQLREENACFDPTSLLYRKADRERVADAIKRTATFPRGLWRDILTFGFRLVTNVKGFAFAESHAETHPHNPSALMAEVLDEVERFRWRVHVEMFAAAARDREIGSVCELVLSGLRGEMMDEALAEDAGTREDGPAHDASHGGPASPPSRGDP